MSTALHFGAATIGLLLFGVFFPSAFGVAVLLRPACRLLICFLFVILIVAPRSLAQTNTVTPSTTPQDVNLLQAQQTALILGLDKPIQKVRMLQSQRSRGASPTVEELLC